jgi:hypothetical protein
MMDKDRLWGQMILVPKDTCPCRNVKLTFLLQQLQLYTPAATRIFGDTCHLSPQLVSVHHTLLQTIDINLITNFRPPPFTDMWIWLELSSPSYFELAVPDDPRLSSPPDAKVEVCTIILENCAVNTVDVI